MDEASEVNSAAIVAGGEAAEMFETIEASLDLVSVLVDGDVVRDEDLMISLGLNHACAFMAAVCSRKPLLP